MSNDEWTTNDDLNQDLVEGMMKNDDESAVVDGQVAASVAAFTGGMTPKEALAMKVREKLIRAECEFIANMLAEKNRNYGDSALNPVRIMSQADPVEQIKVRIDDKLSRIKRGKSAGEDVIQDIIGYFILLRIAMRRQEAPMVVPAGTQDALPEGRLWGANPNLCEQCGQVRLSLDHRCVLPEGKPVAASSPDALVMLRNLLARIHRDGGQHTEAVGLAQSVEDADGCVAALYADDEPTDKSWGLMVRHKLAKARGMLEELATLRFDPVIRARLEDVLTATADPDPRNDAVAAALSWLWSAYPETRGMARQQIRSAMRALGNGPDEDEGQSDRSATASAKEPSSISVTIDGQQVDLGHIKATKPFAALHDAGFREEPSRSDDDDEGMAGGDPDVERKPICVNCGYAFPAHNAERKCMHRDTTYEPRKNGDRREPVPPTPLRAEPSRSDDGKAATLDEQWSKIKPCPTRDCMLRLDHGGDHRFGAADPVVKLVELGMENLALRHQLSETTKELDAEREKVGLLLQPLPTDAPGDFPWQMMRLWTTTRDAEKRAHREEIERLTDVAAEAVTKLTEGERERDALRIMLDDAERERGIAETHERYNRDARHAAERARDSLRVKLAEVERERDEAKRLLLRRVEASRLGEANAEIGSLRAQVEAMAKVVETSQKTEQVHMDHWRSKPRLARPWWLVLLSDALDAYRSVTASGARPGERSTAEYSELEIAIASADGTLRVDPDGLGWIRDTIPSHRTGTIAAKEPTTAAELRAALGHEGRTSNSDEEPACTCTGPARPAHDKNCPVRKAHPRVDLGDEPSP